MMKSLRVSKSTDSFMTFIQGLFHEIHLFCCRELVDTLSTLYIYRG